MRLELDVPQPIEKLRKVYNDRVTFVTTVSKYPLVDAIEFNGDYLTSMKKRAVPVKIGKQVDKITRKYEKRLRVVWNKYQKEILSDTKNPSNEVHKADAPTLAQVLAETDPTRQAVLRQRYLKARQDEVIKPKIDNMNEDLKRAAVPIFAAAFLLGKHRGQILTNQEIDDTVTKKDQDILDTKKEWNDEYIDNLTNETYENYQKALEEGYESSEALDEALAKAQDSEDHRLTLFAAVTGSVLLAAGMTQAIKDVQKVDPDTGEPTGDPILDEDTGLPIGDVILGGIWHTSQDNSVCDGCDTNEGVWMTLEDFEAEAGTNECLTRCRCIELFEPTEQPPEESQKVVKGGAGSGNFNHAGRPGEVGGSGEGGAVGYSAAKDPSKPFIGWGAEHNYEGKFREQRGNTETRQASPAIEQHFGQEFSSVVNKEIEEAAKHLKITPAISEKEFTDSLTKLSNGKIAQVVVARQRELGTYTQDLKRYEDQKAQGLPVSDSWVTGAKEGIKLQSERLVLAQSAEVQKEITDKIAIISTLVGKQTTLADQMTAVSQIKEKFSNEWAKAARGKDEKADVVSSVLFNIITTKQQELETINTQTLEGYMNSHRDGIKTQWENLDALGKHRASQSVEGGAQSKTVQSRRNYQDGRDWIKANVSPDILSRIAPVEWQAKRGSRSYYFSEDRTIKIAQDDRASTIPHEFMHHIEQQLPEFKTFFEQYYNIRTTGENAVRLNKASPGRGYSSSEYTRVDKWTNPYMGHTNFRNGSEYRKGGEIFSTAVGMLASNRDAAELYRKDPELFGITIATLKGHLPRTRVVTEEAVREHA